MNITIPVVAKHMSVVPTQKSDGDIWITEVAHCHKQEDADRIAACLNFCIGLSEVEMENCGSAVSLIDEINQHNHDIMTRL